MKKARLIKALLDNKLLHSDDRIESAKMSSEELTDLDGSVLVVIKRRKRKDKNTLKPDNLSHFTFSDGKNSFMFFSKDKDRVGAIADFILDFTLEEEKESNQC
jgi:hypothetical protein